MAGRISVGTYKARRVQLPADAFDCTECEEFVTVGTLKNPVGTERLMEYWAHGKGALKIRWFTDGAYKRCVRHLRKYFPRNPHGLCANLEKRATGHWPAEKIIDS